MWTPTYVKAVNLLSFPEFEYDIIKDKPTFIYGENLTDSSQSSNGSGKSTFLEAIPIATTGMPLRKVGKSEIIRDFQKEAFVRVDWLNDETKDTLKIEWNFFQKVAALCSIYENDSETPVELSGVEESKKYILERLGVTIDELYQYFFLSTSTAKYKPFFLQSDTEIKKSINRFSRGAVVDEAIEKMQDDKEVAEKSLTKADNSHIEKSGALRSVVEMLEREKNKPKQDNSQQIKDATDNISIRDSQIKVLVKDEVKATKKISQLEASKIDLTSTMNGANEDLPINTEIEALSKKALDVGLDMGDVIGGVDEIEDKADVIQSEIDGIEKKSKDESKKIKTHSASVKQIKADIGKLDSRAKTELLNEKWTKLNETLTKTSISKENISDEIDATNKKIASLKNKLAGKITCPSCSHEFILADEDFDVEEKEMNLNVLIVDVDSLERDLAEDDSIMVEIQSDIDTVSGNILSITNQETELDRQLDEQEYKITKINNLIIQYNSDIGYKNTELDKIDSEIDDYISNKYQDVFDHIDKSIDDLKYSAKKIGREIAECEGVIKAQKSVIKMLKEAKPDGTIKTLKGELVECEADLSDAKEVLNSKQKEFDEFVVQEELYKQFKTQLANEKVGALEDRCNLFLNKIGSDITVSINAFKKLKNGETRSKITPKLLRNGIDIGSYGRLSAGERTRVDVATILAMRELININADNSKGIDFILMDEILNATDSEGMSFILEALDRLEITSFLISHQFVPESHEPTVKVVKENDKSRLEINN